MVKVFLTWASDLKHDHFMEVRILPGFVARQKYYGVQKWIRVSINAVVLEKDHFSLIFNLCFWELVEFQYFNVCLVQGF